MIYNNIIFVVSLGDSFNYTLDVLSLLIKPFLFPFPGGVPPALLRPLIAFNRGIEKTPFFRWQCANVSIQIEFEQ